MPGTKKNILVMTHGEFAKGIKNSVEMILGEQENFETLIFTSEMSLEKLVDDLKAKLLHFENEATIIFVDLFGGSPSNAIVQLLAEGYDIQAISGVNLPMLLEVLGNRQTLSTNNLLEQGVIAGREGILDIVNLLK